MEYWEFLIQKEGDRAWLPLESPTVEILEGRYRIVARSSYVNAAVEVRIAFLPEDAALGGGRQRVQKRSGQTNGDGVLAIVPYTQLRPGRWEFRCSALEEADPWRYEMELQVLSVESDLWLEPIAPMADPGESGDIVGAAGARAGESAELPIAEPTPPGVLAPESVVEALPEISRTPEEANIPAIAVGESSGDQHDVAPIAEAEVEVEGHSPEELTQTAEAGVPDGALVSPEPTGDLNTGADGAIAPEPTADPTPPPTSPPPQEPAPFMPPRDRLLQGGGDRLVRVADRLAQGNSNVASPPPTGTPSSAERPTLPIALQSDRLRLALEHSTYITAWGRPLTLDGVISLEGDPREATTPTLPVGLELQVSLRDPATQRMVVCLSRPLHHCALGATDANALPLPCPFALDVELPVESQGFLLLGHLGLYRATVASDEPLVEQTFTVAADATLLMRAIDPAFSPERCAQAAPVQRPSPSGRLPFQAHGSTLDTQLLNFVSGRQGASAQPALPPPPTSTRSRPLVSPTLPGEPRRPQRPQGQSSPSPLSSQPSTAPAIAPQAVPQATPQTPAVPQTPAAPPPAFAAKAPAAPPPLGHDQRFWGRLNALADDRELEHWLASHGEHASPPLPEPLAADAELVQREIVIEEGPPSPRSPVQNPDLKALAALPVPTPRLSIATDPLVGGQPAIVRVRVADTGAQLLVKFWVEDRQTRNFIVMPQWLSQMRPNGLDELEAKVTLNLPPDLLEVTLQAVTMDAATNRQSHRAELVASVVPPFERPRDRPLPDPLGLDLFELPRSQRRDR
ncbi:MAG: hypothetical protein MH825_04575 [Cyanobacteria bacterium]|nr:hypothetical protein [Cyanobacteriota bacterium]